MHVNNLLLFKISLKKMHERFFGRISYGNFFFKADTRYVKHYPSLEHMEPQVYNEVELKS